jgi:hypothetical protein
MTCFAIFMGGKTSFFIKCRKRKKKVKRVFAVG